MTAGYNSPTRAKLRQSVVALAGSDTTALLRRTCAALTVEPPSGRQGRVPRRPVGSVTSHENARRFQRMSDVGKHTLPTGNCAAKKRRFGETLTRWFAGKHGSGGMSGAKSIAMLMYKNTNNAPRCEMLPCNGIENVTARTQSYRHGGLSNGLLPKAGCLQRGRSNVSIAVGRQPSTIITWAMRGRLGAW